LGVLCEERLEENRKKRKRKIVGIEREFVEEKPRIEEVGIEIGNLKAARSRWN
jgi:hypothetical protein